MKKIVCIILMLWGFFGGTYAQNEMSYRVLQKINLTSSSLNLSPNTYYEIRGIIDLRGKVLNIPDGCFLDFRNGRFLNGTISGNLLNEYLRPEWFGANGDGKSDDTKAIQNTLNSGKNIVMSGAYCISKPLLVGTQGITLEKSAILKAIGDSIDYLIKYQSVNTVMDPLIYLDGGGTLDCSGICGGIYYNLSKTYRLQNLTIYNVAKNPALAVYKGYIESYNVECNGLAVDKSRQPQYNVLLAGGSDHKFDRWTVITKTVGFKGCSGSSIFTRVHIWGNSDCGFIVTGNCTFNMCYTDYCKIGFKLPAGFQSNLCVVNHNTIGPSTNTLIYSEVSTVKGTLSFGAKLDEEMPLVTFAPSISNRQILLNINDANMALTKGSTEQRPNIKIQNKDVMVGFQYYDTSFGRPFWWDGKGWISYSDYERGTSVQRPINAKEGDMYYDSSLKRMILFNGIKWVNLDGRNFDK